MFFTYSLYASLVICGLGILYRLYKWFSAKAGIETVKISFGRRIGTALTGIVKTIFSIKIFTLIKALLLDVLLQRRTLREDFLRWIMHIFIYVGFTLLLLMHALDKIITVKLYPEYYSTINPFMFLRDLFGLIVLVGIVIALYRRFIRRVPRLSTNAMDVYALVIIIIIILSGILLEGLKITSYTRYQEMVKDYGAADGEEQLRALEAYWVKEFSVVSPRQLSFDVETLRLGKEIHDMSCADCHSRPHWAFTGFAVAKLITPVARGMDEANMMTILLYIHFLSSFIALAYLPFSKMFHIIATPVSLLAGAVMTDESDPANVATRQIMELDACTHCGTCSLRCSALAAFHVRGNSDILPSEKMQHIRALVNGRKLKDSELRSLQEGVYICTNCDRCTVVCPSGINLRELWFGVRELLIQNGYPLLSVLSPLSFSRGLRRERLPEDEYRHPLEQARGVLTEKLHEIQQSDTVLSHADIDTDFLNELGMSTDANTYSQCFSCSTCTTSCPVVGNYDNPIEVLGLLPHQIIHAAVLGLKDLALGSRMLWDCLTCYQCQENCPQQVHVADVFYKLKNIAIAESMKHSEEEEVSRRA